MGICNYINYLKERNYDYYIDKKDHVNLKKSLELLLEKYKTKKLTVINSALSDKVGEISLKIPIIGDKLATGKASLISDRVSLWSNKSQIQQVNVN